MGTNLKQAKSNHSFSMRNMNIFCYECCRDANLLASIRVINPWVCYYSAQWRLSR